MTVKYTVRFYDGDPYHSDFVGEFDTKPESEEAIEEHMLLRMKDESFVPILHSDYEIITSVVRDDSE